MVGRAWSSRCGDDYGEEVWETIAHDLSYAAGHEVRFGFRFNPDGSVWTGTSAERYHGVFIDRVRLETTCAPQPCATLEDCGRGDCVTTSCQDGHCVNQVSALCCTVDSQVRRRQPVYGGRL